MNMRPASGRPGPRGVVPPAGVVRPGSQRGGSRGPTRPEAAAPRQGGDNDAEGNRLSKWELKGQISKGSFGVVYKALNKEDGQLYALKEVDLKGMNRADRQEAMDEARILSTLDSPYITQHYESFIENGKLHIVMELATAGSLHAKIKAQNGKGLPEDTVWRYFIEALLAVNHLHSKKIIHRDIKSLNLFLTETGDIMLGDLGIARAMSENTQFLKSLVGTPYYLSPELCNDKPYNEKSDIWALGVVLYEMCMTVHPFTARNEGALVRKILTGVYSPVKGYSSQVNDMVRQCLTFKYQSRPDSFQLLRNPVILRKAAELNINLRPAPRKKVAPRQKAAPLPAQHEPEPNRPEEQRQQQVQPRHAESPARMQDKYEAAQLARRPVPQPAAGSPWPEPAAHGYDDGSDDGGDMRWAHHAAGRGGQEEQAWAPPRPSPAEMAAKQRQGAGEGAVPGGLDPCQPTPPAPHHRQQHRAPQPMHTAGARGGGGRDAAAAAYPYGYQEGAGGALGYEMEQRLRLAEQDAALRAAVAAGRQGYARGQHPGQQDNLGSMFKAAYVDDESFEFPRPGVHNVDVDARTAGRAQPMDSHRGAAPFAFDDGSHTGTRGRTDDANPDLWNVSIPQHGRRRAADLHITGPSLRGNSARGGGNTAGRYDHQGAITSTTTYATPSMAPSTFFGGP